MPACRPVTGSVALCPLAYRLKRLDSHTDAERIQEQSLHSRIPWDTMG